MHFIEEIKMIMTERGLTQQKLADALGVNQTTVGQWLAGNKKPSYDNILAIYKKFGITPNMLFGID